MSKTNTAIAASVYDVLRTAAENPTISLTSKDVSRVANGIVEQVAPIVTNATNAEEWWKSRIYWGLIIAGFATVAKPIIGELPITTEQAGDIANALATAGQAVGIAYAWYGRWKGRKLKPLGEATGTGAASL